MRAIVLSIGFLAAGCGTITTAQYGSMTAGLIGCPSSEIVISEEKNILWAGDGMEWRAACRGHRYICSGAGTAAACKEELQPAAPAASAPAAAPAVASGATSK